MIAGEKKMEKKILTTGNLKGRQKKKKPKNRIMKHKRKRKRRGKAGPVMWTGRERKEKQCEN